MELRRSVITGETCACTAIMADRTTLDQYIALLPERSAYAPTHPLGCHRPRISDRIVFDKMLQLLRFGCSYQAIADTTCSATTIRNRRDEWSGSASSPNSSRSRSAGRALAAAARVPREILISAATRSPMAAPAI
jgi:transposase